MAAQRSVFTMLGDAQDDLRRRVVEATLLSLFQGITRFEAGKFRGALGNLVALFSSLTHGLTPVA